MKADISQERPSSPTSLKQNGSKPLQTEEINPEEEADVDAPSKEVTGLNEEEDEEVEEKEEKEVEEENNNAEEGREFLIQEKMAMEAVDIKIDTTLLTNMGLTVPFFEPSAGLPPPLIPGGPDPFTHRAPGGQGQVLWTGFLSKTNIEKCKVAALHVSGPHTSSIQSLLPQTLHVQGRVEFPKLASYLLQLASSRSREHSIICFEPQGEESEMAYIAMLHYFSLRQRAGVVINL